MSLRKSTLKGDLHQLDSVVNLTKPELYSLFNSNDSSLEINEQDLKIIDEKRKKKEQTEITKETKSFNLFTKLFVISITIYGYLNILQLTQTTSVLINNHIQSSNSLLQSHHIGFLGISAVILVPLLDKYLLLSGSDRLLSSNPNKSNNKAFYTEIIRSCITFLGINYAIRNLQWSSFLQISSVWSLLNPALWLLLDGTVNGFLSSLLLSTIVCSFILWNNHSYLFSLEWNSDFWAIWLWIGSFVFGGGIVFGKIGRGLRLLD